MTRSITLQQRMAQRRPSEATNRPSSAPTTATTSAERGRWHQDQMRAVRARQTSTETAAVRAQNRDQMRAARAAHRQDQVHASFLVDAAKGGWDCRGKDEAMPLFHKCYKRSGFAGKRLPLQGRCGFGDINDES